MGMDEKVLIEGIKQRLYSQCELRPSEVLVLKHYIEQLEAMKELEDLTEDDIPWLRGEGEDGEDY